MELKQTVNVTKDTKVQLKLTRVSVEHSDDKQSFDIRIKWHNLKKCRRSQM